jgi:hypothetical protein
MISSPSGSRSVMIASSRPAVYEVRDIHQPAINLARQSGFGQTCADRGGDLSER